MEDTELKIGGFTFKGWYIAAALPILTALSSGIYFGYDTVQRFYAVESGIEEVVEKSASFDSTSVALSSRIQALEQAVQDNDVRGLNARLSQIGTQMQTILEQQRTLLDLRSQIERSTTITDGIGDKLDTLQIEIDDIWEAYDSLVENPL